MPGLTGKLKAVLVIAFLIVFLLTLKEAVAPTPSSAVLSPGLSGIDWLRYAEVAWRYYAPGVGVEVGTGLHHAGLYWPYFTDWDLGNYIVAVLDAYELGLIRLEGEWGLKYRLEKVLRFLEERPLTADGTPYNWYDSRTGKNHGSGGSNPSDEGRLLVALSLLVKRYPEYLGRVLKIVERNGFKKLASNPSGWGTSFYHYFVAQGFKEFGMGSYPYVLRALKAFEGRPYVDVYGLLIPEVPSTAEPILHLLLELEPEEEAIEYGRLIYLAHEERFKRTDKFTAFSEGNTGGDPSYVYEWIIASSGKTWLITDSAGRQVNVKPIVYLKVALAFHALYNTEYTLKLVNHLMGMLATYDLSAGFPEGVDEDGTVVNVIIDRTNSLIISAARYALSKASLAGFPSPFIVNGLINNTLIVIAESKARYGLHPAHTSDVIGAVHLASTLASKGRGEVKVAMDGWLVKAVEGVITLTDNASNIISIGSPGVNLVSYHYNLARDEGGRPLMPILFILDPEGNHSLYSWKTGKQYWKRYNAQGQLLEDYAVIQLRLDRYGRYVMLIYGIGADGSRMASEALKNPRPLGLRGCAAVLKCYASKPGGPLDSMEVVEVVPLLDG